MKKKKLLTVTLISVMSIAAAMMMGCGDNKSSSQADNNQASSSISSDAGKNASTKTDNLKSSTDKQNNTLLEKTTADTLPTKAGIDIQSELAQIDAQASAIDTRLQNENLTQNQMNQLTAQVYKLWDDKLNSMWSYLSDTLDNSTMKTLKEEERNWLKKKDSLVKEAGQEAAGGSMQAMLENTKAAELTRDRVYELAKYYK